MPDDLDVSGGSSSAVSTEDLDVAAEQLARLAGEASALAADLGRLEPPFMHSSSHVDQAAIDIDVAAGHLRDVAAKAALLHALLLTAGRGYVLTERLVDNYFRVGRLLGAEWLGAHVVGLLSAGGIATVVGFGSWLGIRSAGGLDPAMRTAFEGNGIPKGPQWARDANFLWNNSFTVSAVRAASDSLGAFTVGMTGAPQGTALLLGTGSYRLGAKGVVELGRSVDLLNETGVKLVETTALRPAAAAPSDYVDRLARVPYREDGTGPQVMIEKYTSPEGPDRYCVYITGTVTFSPASDEPWDMTSNLANAAGEESGSIEAVRLAMREAGIDENSPVQFTGYSQGGGTAASLAASGLYNTQGLTTFGGPTGQIPIEHGFPAVLVEHSDDLVPALGGEQSNLGAVLVRRDVFGGHPPADDYVFPAHHYEYYVATARLMDESGSPQLDESMRQLDAFTEGATLESSTGYRFERTED